MKVKFSVRCALKAKKTAGLKNSGFSTWPGNFGLMWHAAPWNEKASTHANLHFWWVNIENASGLTLIPLHLLATDAECCVAFFTQIRCDFEELWFWSRHLPVSQIWGFSARLPISTLKWMHVLVWPPACHRLNLYQARYRGPQLLWYRGPQLLWYTLRSDLFRALTLMFCYIR